MNNNEKNVNRNEHMASVHEHFEQPSCITFFSIFFMDLEQENKYTPISLEQRTMHPEFKTGLATDHGDLPSKRSSPVYNLDFCLPSC